MRRFNVHLVTEVDFEDGDEASDETVQNYQIILEGWFRARPKRSRSGQSRTPGSRVSRSKKSRTARRTPSRQLPSRAGSRPSRVGAPNPARQ